MAGDKFSAVWVSHSSLGDYAKCPRLYYLNNVYKDPKTGHKVQLMQPPLALGQAVHEVVESLSVLPAEERFRQPLSEKYELAWKKVAGRTGGFLDERTEREYKARGQEMLARVTREPGPLRNKAVKIRMDLPQFWLSEDDNIILCGKIDWLEYLPESDGVRIIDFKTGRREEREDSLQLPIYLLLVENCQSRKVEGAGYWYLGRDKGLIEVELPESQTAREKVLKAAKKVKLARQLRVFECPEGKTGCRFCRPMEMIVKGKGELVGVSEYNQDVYILPSASETEKISEVL